MKFKVDRATLLKALAHVQSVVERRNTIPILANVMIAVRDGKLTLTATDMEIAIVEDVAADSVRNGACTAPAATLYEIVRKLPDGAVVELDCPGGDAPLALRAGRYATSLVVLPTEDFPAMTAGTLPHKFALPAQTLRGLIDRTRFAISTEETRYYLNGIYIHQTEADGAAMPRTNPPVPEPPDTQTRCVSGSGRRFEGAGVSNTTAACAARTVVMVRFDRARPDIPSVAVTTASIVPTGTEAPTVTTPAAIDTPGIVAPDVSVIDHW